jgi:hypothetical protein
MVGDGCDCRALLCRELGSALIRRGCRESVLSDTRFHDLLLAFDRDLADAARSAGCALCSGVVTRQAQQSGSDGARPRLTSQVGDRRRAQGRPSHEADVQGAGEASGLPFSMTYTMRTFAPLFVQPSCTMRVATWNGSPAFSSLSG